MAWNKTKDVPIISLLQKLASIYVKTIELRAVKQTHKAMLQIKSAAHSERKRRERQERLDRTKS